MFNHRAGVIIGVRISMARSGGVAKKDNSKFQIVNARAPEECLNPFERSS